MFMFWKNCPWLLGKRFQTGTFWITITIYLHEKKNVYHKRNKEIVYLYLYNIAACRSLIPQQ